MASIGVHAQELASDPGLRRTVAIVPRVSVTETLTDNVRLSNSGRQSELITEISPGILISSEVGRLKGHFDYSLSELVYAKNSSPNQSHNALNTFGTLEAVDNWAYLDFNGAISQQAISAFGTQSLDNASVNANRTEVSSYRLSPYVRGRVGSLASYEARYSRAVTSSDAATGSDVSTADGMVRISGDSSFKNLGWAMDASQQRVDYSAGRSTETDRLNLRLSFAVTTQFNVFANGGREANNYTSVDKQRYGTSGFGMNWSPSEMTTISAQKDHRSFGDTHNVSFEHRTARTAWRFSDSKDVSATPSQTGIASLGSVYDLLYSQFASLEPNPTARAKLVNAYLQANGISPNAIVISSFLTAAVALERRQDLSLALLGVRDTITFIATRSEGTRLDTVSTGIDDFSNSSLVRQRGFIVNYAHRLTPDYSLGILASQQKTSGDSSQPDTTLRSFNINVSGRVGRKATASVGVRRVVYSGNTASYSETAVIGSLTVLF
ncbi:MAG: TIGR03016 family PEP-CTERM system-associated outer membrane protein [Rhodoferax sp.]